MAAKKSPAITTLGRHPLPLAIVVVLGLLSFWIWQKRTRQINHLPVAQVTSCNAVSSISQASIDQARSAATRQVVIAYTLTNTVDTGLNCFLLATVKDSAGIQIG